MSLAPLAYLLFQRVMRHDPADPHWVGRDRFVLSCGHSSLTLYIQLYLGGFGLELRRPGGAAHLGLADPGPPGVPPHDGRRDHHRPAGPGPGIAVGMAMAARRERGPARPGRRARASRRSTTRSMCSPPTATWRRASPARRPRSPAPSSWATCRVYDHNQISIEDDTDIAFSEDVAAAVRGVRLARADGRLDRAAPSTTRTSRRSYAGARGGQGGDRPAVVHPLRTIIGWPAPNAQNTGKAHGSALGDDEVAATKKILGFDPDADLRGRPTRCSTHTRRLRRPRPRGRRPSGSRRFDAWAEANPERKALLDRMIARRLPDGWTDALPACEPTRRAWPPARRPGKVLDALAPVLPELWGGSADLAESQQHHDEGRAVVPARRTGRRSTGTATRTAAPCTSASASTPWARS